PGPHRQPRGIGAEHTAVSLVVDRVDAGRADRDAGLPGPGLGGRLLDHREHLGTAERGGDHNRRHACGNITAATAHSGAAGRPPAAGCAAASAGYPGESRRARARRLPSCIAWTPATGIAWPPSTRSVLNGCAGGICPAHGSPPASRAGTVCTVKSAGATRSRSSQARGNDTGTPGLARGL